jgi:hypothetical protein
MSAGRSQYLYLRFSTAALLLLFDFEAPKSVLNPCPTPADLDSDR